MKEAERRKQSVNFREAEGKQESSREIKKQTKKPKQAAVRECSAEESRLPGWKCKEMMFSY